VAVLFGPPCRTPIYLRLVTNRAVDDAA